MKYVIKMKVALFILGNANLFTSVSDIIIPGHISKLQGKSKRKM